MHYFHVPEKITGSLISITGTEQLHHLKNVLRLKTGDEVVVFDGSGTQFSCRIVGIERTRAILSINSQKTSRSPAYKLAVACALPKRAKMDEIVDKLTQLGVDTIIPMVTERVIIKLDEKDDRIFRRWQKIALNASEQSQRGTLPILSRIKYFNEILAESSEYSLKLIPTLESERKTLQTAISSHSTSNVLVMIGPEGDFSPNEVHQARERGFIPISLGEYVLRVDTAAIAVASFFRLLLS